MKAIKELSSSREMFFRCVKGCNESSRLGHDLDLYREIIKMHRETNDIDILLDSERFVRLIRQTLVAWNMNQRGAKLTDLEKLKQSILSVRKILKKLYEYKLYEINYKNLSEITAKLELIFGFLKVMESKRRIVGVSKTLHFLLPDLVMPIDGKYTMEAVYGFNKFSNTLEKETTDFMNIFEISMKIARRLNLTDADVSGEQWNTSVPKLIDNAIIGMVKSKKAEKKHSIERRYEACYSTI